MKTIDIGHYYIKNNKKKNNSILISDMPTFIGIHGQTLYPYDKAFQFEQYDAVLLVQVFLEKTEVRLLHANNQSCLDKQEVLVDIPFIIGEYDLTLEFECKTEKLEDAIDAFKMNALFGQYNIKQMLIKYAQLEKLSQKQAFSYIVTTLDIPEIDS